ncbi:MAG: helicase, partial [Propionibacteriaceae bacterium]|nr:helicase [Propionibacteriaceae bacterium]
ADLPNAVRSAGCDPELINVPEAELLETTINSIRKLAAAVEGTIGIIIPPSRSELAEQLTVNTEFLSLKDRIIIVSPLGVKGLEFDAGIIVSPDQIVTDSPAGERVLYVCLTRPTRNLITIDVGEPGKWIPQDVI